jgi:hypothetical protein
MSLTKITRNAFTIVIGVAVIVRLAFFFWGIPLLPGQGYYNPDETKVIRTTALFPDAYLQTPDPMYGMASVTISGIILSPLKLALLKTHWMQRTEPPYGINEGYFLIAAIAARLVSLLLGIFTVALTYVLARRIFGRNEPAFFAGLMVAVSPLCMQYSDAALVDGPMLFGVMLCFYLLYEYVTRPSRQTLLLLGTSSGFLLGTKISGVLFLLFPIVAIVFCQWVQTKTQTSWRRVTLVGGAVLLYCLATYIVFIISTPLALDMKNYYAMFVRYKSYEKAVFSVPLSLGIINQWVSVLKSATGFSAVVLFASFLGLLRFKLNRSHYYILWLAALFLLATLLFWSWHFYLRYAVIFIPFIMIGLVSFLDGCIHIAVAVTKKQVGREQAAFANRSLLVVGIIIGSIYCLTVTIPTIFTAYRYYGHVLGALYITKNFPKNIRMGYMHVDTFNDGSKASSLDHHFPYTGYKYFSRINTLSSDNYDLVIVSKTDIGLMQLELDRANWIAPYVLKKEVINNLQLGDHHTPEEICFYETVLPKDYTLVYDADDFIPAQFKKYSIRNEAIMIYKKKSL